MDRSGFDEVDRQTILDERVDAIRRNGLIEAVVMISTEKQSISSDCTAANTTRNRNKIRIYMTPYFRMYGCKDHF